MNMQIAECTVCTAHLRVVFFFFTCQVYFSGKHCNNNSKYVPSGDAFYWVEEQRQLPCHIFAYYSSTQLKGGEVIFKVTNCLKK